MMPGFTSFKNISVVFENPRHEYDIPQIIIFPNHYSKMKDLNAKTAKTFLFRVKPKRATKRN